MYKFFKIIQKIAWIMMGLAVVIDFVCLLLPDTSFEAKRQAAIFGLVNCALMYITFETVWLNNNVEK